MIPCDFCRRDAKSRIHYVTDGPFEAGQCQVYRNVCGFHYAETLRSIHRMGTVLKIDTLKEEKI